VTKQNMDFCVNLYDDDSEEAGRLRKKLVEIWNNLLCGWWRKDLDDFDGMATIGSIFRQVNKLASATQDSINKLFTPLKKGAKRRELKLKTWVLDLPMGSEIKSAIKKALFARIFSKSFSKWDDTEDSEEPAE